MGALDLLPCFWMMASVNTFYRAFNKLAQSVTGDLDSAVWCGVFLARLFGCCGCFLVFINGYQVIKSKCLLNFLSQELDGRCSLEIGVQIFQFCHKKLPLGTISVATLLCDCFSWGLFFIIIHFSRSGHYSLMHWASSSYFTPSFFFEHHNLQDHDLHSAAAAFWLSSCLDLQHLRGITTYFLFSLSFFLFCFWSLLIHVALLSTQIKRII